MREVPWPPELPWPLAVKRLKPASRKKERGIFSQGSDFFALFRRLIQPVVWFGNQQNRP